MSHNRCKDTHKFGNKYLRLAYKTQVDFRSHFSGKKVRLIVQEIQYVVCYAIRTLKHMVPQETLLTVYFSYFHSVMSYGINFLDSSLCNINIFRLNK